MTRGYGAAARGGFAALLVTLLMVTGCGVPDHSEPVRLGVPRQQAGSQDLPGGAPPLGPSGVSDADELLRRYLQASAWGNSLNANRPNALTDAVRRVGEFLGPAANWQPGERFTLVRVTWPEATRTGPGPHAIPAKVETVGVLDGNGSVAEPDVPAAERVRDHTFHVGDIGNGQLRVLDPLPGLVFDIEQILTWYHQRTIYFYGDGQTLIPDVRYLPKDVGPDGRPGEVLRWLLAGPSEWLRPVVAPVPDRIALSGNVVVDPRDVIDINLTAKAAGLEQAQLEAFQIQARWSLGGEFGAPEPQIRLLIEQSPARVNVSDQTYRQANPAFANQGVDPARFCVLGGQIRPVQGGPVPLLDTDHNRDVATASIAANRRSVAYIRNEGSGGRAQQRLWVSTGPGGQTDTAQTRNIQGPAYRTMGRPVWLNPNGQRLLVVGNESLYLASAADDFSVHVKLGPDRVTSVAVAPDGRRIAYVSDGHVFVALLRTDGNEVSLVQRRELLTTLVRQTAVAWLTQDRVVVAGQSSVGSPMVELSIDGTQVREVKRTGLEPALQIGRLAAFPDAPTGDPRYLMMLEAGGTAYNVFGTEIRRLDCRAEVSPGASPGSGQTTAQATAPFFLG